MGGAPSLLGWRAAAFAADLALLLAYYLLVGHLWNASLWPDIAWLDLVLIPAVFLLVYLALPLWNHPRVGWLACAFAAVAVVAELAGWDILGNFAKLGAMAFVAWWFLQWFESLAWVVLVAAIIPVVDIYSVFAGPTKAITTNHQQTFYVLSFAFPTPGNLGAANLGLPDLLFFSLFCAAAVRFGLRPFWTWLGGVVSFGSTMALAVGLSVDGLPALPLLSVAFLLVNADLIWRRLRPARRAA